MVAHSSISRARNGMPRLRAPCTTDSATMLSRPSDRKSAVTSISAPSSSSASTATSAASVSVSGAADGPSSTGMRGKRGFVDLAVRCQRHLVDDDDAVRNHVARQPFRQHAAQLRHVGRRVGGDVCDQPRPAARPLANRDVGVAHRGVGVQHRRDLGGLDAESADLDLRVGAAEELQRAVGPASHHVAGAVHPLAPARTGRRRTGPPSRRACRDSRGSAGGRTGTARRARRRARAAATNRARTRGCDMVGRPIVGSSCSAIAATTASTVDSVGP